MLTRYLKYTALLFTAAWLSNNVSARAQLYSYSVPAGGFDPAGNITTFTDSVNGTWSFSYDPLDRVSTGGATTGPYQGLGLSWSYDSFGNRLGQSASGTPPTAGTFTRSASYDANNRLTRTETSASMSYDASGNFTSDGVSRTAYDAEGRVCATYSSVGASGITQYIYNAEGQRVAKGHPTDGSNVLACANPANFTPTATYVLGQGGEQMTELNGQGVWQHTNVYAAGKLLATYDNQGLHFPLTDPLGTVRVQASGEGATEETCSSLPFGDVQSCVMTSITQEPTEHHFTGKERDTESGLDYFGARYYASSMGRFMSPDWAAKAEPVPYARLDDPQSLNLYTYGGNNPLSHTDPDGHCDVDGEHHGGLWCFGHALGLVETQHEQANDARNFFANNNVMINGQHVDPSKLNDQQANSAFKQYNDAYRANGGALSPGAALAGMLPGAGLKYESNPKHGSSAVGNVSAEPTNPQQTLDNSVPIKNTSTARVGVDPSTGEYVMFRDNGQGVYHGYAVKNFNDLPNEAKAALQDAGMVSQRGKIQ